MTVTSNEDPAAIEREIRITQDNMSSTVEKIGDQLSIKNLFNAMLDKADNSNIDARALLDGARRNPVALGLIAAGAIWLVSDKDSKLPTLRKAREEDLDTENFDPHHRDYVSHMSAVEKGQEEGHDEYQRRRDLARSNFFMVERNHDEDESNFRARLDAVAEKFGEKRRAFAQNSARIGTAAKEKALAAGGKAKDLYSDNPLVAGIVAAAVGAAFGSSLPVTRQEQNSLGPLGSKVRDVVDQKKEAAIGQVQEKKDELLDKADQAIRQPAAEFA